MSLDYVPPVGDRGAVCLRFPYLLLSVIPDCVGGLQLPLRAASTNALTVESVRLWVLPEKPMPAKFTGTGTGAPARGYADSVGGAGGRQKFSTSQALSAKVCRLTARWRPSGEGAFGPTHWFLPRFSKTVYLPSISRRARK